MRCIVFEFSKRPTKNTNEHIQQIFKSNYVILDFLKIMINLSFFFASFGARIDLNTKTKHFPMNSQSQGCVCDTIREVGGM